MSMLKRQRELGKSERAARKRAKRHGIRETGFQEPRATVGIAELLAGKPLPENPSDGPEEGTEGKDSTGPPDPASPGSRTR
jgi:hypothetical protein